MGYTVEYQLQHNALITLKPPEIHNSNAIMGAIASKITSLTIV